MKQIDRRINLTCLRARKMFDVNRIEDTLEYFISTSGRTGMSVYELSHLTSLPIFSLNESPGYLLSLIRAGRISEKQTSGGIRYVKIYKPQK